jgi:hypothetical protein
MAHKSSLTPTVTNFRQMCCNLRYDDMAQMLPNSALDWEANGCKANGMRRAPTASNPAGAIVTYARDCAWDMRCLVCRPTEPSYGANSLQFSPFGSNKEAVKHYIKLCRKGPRAGTLGAYQGMPAGDASVPGSGIAPLFADLEYLHSTPLGHTMHRQIQRPTLDPFAGATITGRGGVRQDPTFVARAAAAAATMAAADAGSTRRGRSRSRTHTGAQSNTQ